ncbi:MAG: hypothetical protein WCF96_02185 [Eubacteriales bacterium]
MKKYNIKKAGIIAFAMTGGVLGSGVSLIGKMTKNKFIDNLGNDMVDSAIFTGELVGEALGGANDLITGKIKRNPEREQEGVESLKVFAKDSIHNISSNLVLVAEKSEEAVVSLLDNDREKAVAAAKTLAEVVFIGALTFGAIKIDPKK